MAVYTVQDYIVAIFILLLLFWLTSRYLFTRIGVDRGFLYSMVPVILLAISVRLLADAGVYQKSEYWSVTPGIYVSAFIYGVVLLSISMFIGSRAGIEYWKPAVLIGAIPALYFMFRLGLEMTYYWRVVYPILLGVALTSLVYVFSFTEKVRIFRQKENIAIIFAHMLDASGTFIGMNYYNFSEEHLLPEMVINFAGTPLVMIPLKLVVILSVLYILEKEKYYKIIKFILFILGFGPGARNALLLTLG